MDIKDFIGEVRKAIGHYGPVGFLPHDSLVEKDGTWNITIYGVIHDESKRNGDFMPSFHVDLEDVRKLFDPGEGTFGFPFRMSFKYVFADRGITDVAEIAILGRVQGRPVSLYISADPPRCKRCHRQTSELMYCDRCDRTVCHGCSFCPKDYDFAKASCVDCNQVRN